MSLALALLLNPPSDLEWVLQESLYFCFYVVQFFPPPPSEPPLVFTLIGMHLLGCEFSYCLGVISLSFIFLRPFGFIHGMFAGVGSVIMNESNRGERLGALYESLCSPSDMALSHTASFPSF